jgi:hypothetical protein
LLTPKHHGHAEADPRPRGAVTNACLAPNIVEAILDGRQPKGLRLAQMLGMSDGAAGELRL